MLHFGALDNSIPLSDIDEVAAAHPEVVVHIYDQADHGFSCDGRGSHHAESAQLALGRTVAFLAEHGVVARR